MNEIRTDATLLILAWFSILVSHVIRFLEPLQFVAVLLGIIGTIVSLVNNLPKFIKTLKRSYNVIKSKNKNNNSGQR